jgi:uncharacterized protein YjiS (DUF1127 family)
MAHFEDTPKFATPQGITFGLRDVFAQFWQWASGVVLQMQLARMTGVLNSMTDAQLAQVGISRRDIPQQAARLVGAAAQRD